MTKKEALAFETLKKELAETQKKLLALSDRVYRLETKDRVD